MRLRGLSRWTSGDWGGGRAHIYYLIKCIYSSVLGNTDSASEIFHLFPFSNESQDPIHNFEIFPFFIP